MDDDDEATPMSDFGGENGYQTEGRPQEEKKRRYFTTQINIPALDSAENESLLTHDRRNPYDYCFVFPRSLENRERKYGKEEFYRLFKVSRHEKGPLLHQYPKDFYNEIFDRVVPKGAKRCTPQEYSDMKALCITRVINEKCGLSAYTFTSRKKDRIYIKVRADVGDLIAEAERAEYMMQLSPLVDRGCQIAAHAPFKPQKDLLWLWRKYVHEDGGPTLFRPIDRIKLINNTIERFINHEVLVHRGIAESFYPLHQEPIFSQLKTAWITKRHLCQCFRMPLEPIRSYFGEEVAMYFAWLAFYTTMLIPVSIIGFFAMVEIAAQEGAFGAAYGNKVEKEGIIWLPGMINTIFAIVMACWSSLFMELWNRTELDIAIHWGTTDVEKSIKERPAFYGLPTQENPEGRQPSDLVGTVVVFTEPSGKKKTVWRGRMEIHYPVAVRQNKVMVSTIFLVTTITILACVIVSIYVFRRIMVASDNELIRANAPYIASVCNVIQINVFNVFYTIFAERLTDWENWRTQIEHVGALTRKLFVFQFINNFNTFFYLAFFKAFDIGCLGSCKQAYEGMPYDPSECDANLTMVIEKWGGTPLEPKWNRTAYQTFDPLLWGGYTGNCLKELRIQIMMIFGLNLVMGNVVEVCLPKVMEEMKQKAQEEGARGTEEKEDKPLVGGDGDSVKSKMDTDEIDHYVFKNHEGKRVRHNVSDTEIMVNYDDYDTFDDYLEMMIQYGFVVLFVISFPLTPALALLNNFFELRIDASKICLYMKRPIPVSTGSIGGWKDSLLFLGSLSVVTNGWLFAFHSEMMEGPETLVYMRLIAFIAFLSFVWLLQWIVRLIVPDVPVYLKNIMARHNSLINSLIEGMTLIHDESEQPVAEAFEFESHDLDDSNWQTDR